MNKRETKAMKRNKGSSKAAIRTKSNSDLVTSVQEMMAHKKGQISLKTRTLNIPEAIDVASIRKNFGLTQKQFAEHYGFKLSALKEWEQGRRKPERAARILLKVIALAPNVVEKVLSKEL